MNQAKTGNRNLAVLLLFVLIGTLWSTVTFAGVNEDLVQAANIGNLNEINALLAKGADVNAKTNDGSTALMNASQEGHKDIIDALLSKGADANAKMENGFTALILASRRGHKDIVDALLAKGADINAKTKDGATALYMACYYGRDDIVALLKKHGAGICSLNISRAGTGTVADSEYKNRHKAIFSIGTEHEIGSHKMVHVNRSIHSAITKFEHNDKLYEGCPGFIGERIPLNVSKKGEYWMAVTNGGCAWYQNGVRVWILKNTTKGYKVILLIEDAARFVLFESSSHGLRDIFVSGSTSYSYYEEIYKFNGHNYFVSHKRIIDFFAPGECDGIKNKDICPDRETVRENMW
jgi:hypothetical protein